MRDRGVPDEISGKAINWHGENLHRPECVLCTADGSLFVSDWDGGVCHIDPSGNQNRILANKGNAQFRPNGIALLRDKSFLIANLGDTGGVWRLYESGELEPYLLEVDGYRLPPTNYVMVDGDDRVWITVSTSRRPRSLGYRPSGGDGFIVLVDKGQARVVATNIEYTNEVQIDPQSEWLYVNETFGRKLSRFHIDSAGNLSKPEVVATFGRGIFPDGLAFDERGAVWIVSVVSNTVIVVYADGSQEIFLSDTDETHVDRVEKAYLCKEMEMEHISTVGNCRLKNISSIAFGNDDRKTAYLGCLLGDSIASFIAPAPGVKPVHWSWYSDNAI